jgi:hypothetical protein
MDDSHDSHPDFLREVLTPRPETVERVVRNALSSYTEKTVVEVAPWRASFAAALLAGVALLFAWQLERSTFETSPAAISIVNEGGVVIATSPSGDWLIHSGGDPEPEKSGIIIFSYGDQK